MYVNVSSGIPICNSNKVYILQIVGYNKNILVLSMGGGTFLKVGGHKCMSKKL